MDIYEALFTTRAMRRVKPDPIPIEIQAKIMDAAVRAPSGGNAQTWTFLLVDDPELKAEIGPLYRECVEILWTSIYKDRVDTAAANPDDPRSKKFSQMLKSVEWAAANFESYPVLLFGFARDDNSGGSIFPAIWSAMLAARAEGVGSSLTTILALKGDAVPSLLGVPTENWQMAACVPMGYPLGKWGVAKRRPADEVTYRNKWGTAPGFDNTEPAWTP
ncbi:MAG: nitroreductase family protein [Acidimicrobiales bacterium]